MNNFPDIQSTLSILFKAGDVVELRILHTRRGTVSGYFDDMEKLAQAAKQWSGNAPGVYITVNPVAPDLLARSVNRLTEWVKQGLTTSDANILTRRWLLLDFDPVRPSGISSTDAQHDSALLRAIECRKFLLTLGFWEDSIILGDSGNGGHILVRIDLPNDECSKQLIERCIDAVALLFSDDQVSVDRTVFNAARIWKLYGTMACKGDSTQERPHRLASLLTVPEQTKSAPRELLQKLTAMAPEKPKANPNEGAGGKFDVDRWMQEHGLDTIGPHSWNDGRKWVLRSCLWNSDHTNRSAYVVQFSNGTIAAGCHHNGCAGKGWHDLRDAVEPGWRERGSAEEHDNPWTRAKDAPSFLAEEEKDIFYLEDNILKPGCITELFSPRGVGKTQVAHAFVVRLAKAGKRVLLIDRDNSKREVRRRLRAWGAQGAENLKILARDEAPPLTDTKTWSNFPYQDYDLVTIDSLDASTEGTGEQDSAKPSRAIAPVLDIAHRDEGPAILVLGNTIKSGAHYRGSGVIGDRADIVYEVRDATDLKPSGKKPWWEELPSSGEGDWAARATRRKKRTSYRLAFIPSKFRVGEEPDPFCLEVYLPEGEPWTLRDVTAEILGAGEDAIEKAKREKEKQLEKAAQALVEVVIERARAGEPIHKTAGEDYLRDEGNITREEARKVITGKENVLWKIVPLPGKGKPLGLVPLDWEPPKNESAAKMQGSGEADQKPLSETPISADHAQSERQKYPARNPLPEAGLQGTLFTPPENPGDTGSDPNGEEERPIWEKDL